MKNKKTQAIHLRRKRLGVYLARTVCGLSETLKPKLKLTKEPDDADCWHCQRITNLSK